MPMSRFRSKFEFFCMERQRLSELFWHYPMQLFTLFQMSYEKSLALVVNFRAIRKSMNFGEAQKTKKSQLWPKTFRLCKFWVCHSTQNCLLSLTDTLPRGSDGGKTGPKQHKQVAEIKKLQTAAAPSGLLVLIYPPDTPGGVLEFDKKNSRFNSRVAWSRGYFHTNFQLI